MKKAPRGQRKARKKQVTVDDSAVGKENPSDNAKSKVFSDQWFREVSAIIKDMEESELDKPYHTHSKAMKMLMGYFSLSSIAMQNLSPDQRERVRREAENVCNRLGFSLFSDKESRV